MKLRISLLIILIVTFSLFGSALCLAQTGLTPEQRAQIVQSSGQHFWLEGEPFRFIGYNVRGYVHYGHRDILYWSNPEDRFINGQVVENTGGRVIRVFGSNKYISNVELGNRLEYVLNLAQSYGFRVLYAFTDYYQTGFNPQGDCKYYTSSGGWTLLNHEFFAGGYQENYLPQVTYLVNRFKHHPALFAWQLGNEIKHPADPQVFYNFCMHMHQVIRSIDPYHMISVGIISTWPHTGWSNEQALNIHSTFDFLTFHPYNGAESNEHEWANTVGKPLLIGEAGFSSGDRPQQTSNDIAKWVGRGARGYLQWGLMATGHDNGDGDRMFGVDRVWHADDWHAYLQVYTNWAQQLANTPSPPSQTPVGVTASQGDYTDRVVISWAFEPSAKQYAVFRSTTPSGQAVQVSPWALSLYFNDVSAVPGTTYYYRVKARNNGGESSLSDYASGWALLDTHGSVGGRVFDQDSNPISGAVVTLSPGGQSATSQADGSYIIEMVAPGNYGMTVVKSGFQPWHQQGITVVEYQTTNLDVYLQPISIPNAKNAADGTLVSVGGIVTAVFPSSGRDDIVYIQNPDRSAGIAVAVNTSVSEEDEILVDGYMTTTDGERIVNASDVFVLGNGTPIPNPLSMSNRTLGGGWSGMQSAVLDNSATGGYSDGLSNIGLLVKSWGRVTHVDSGGNFFYIDDGSGLKDGYGYPGVRVASSGLPVPSQNAFVTITGISSTTLVSNQVVRLLRPRSVFDLSYAELSHELTNPGFETGTLSGWTVYGDTDGVISGTWFGGVTAHSGEYFIGNASNWGIRTGGVYQRMAVPTGLNFQARAWSRVYRMDNPEDSAQNRVGIDPTGGTDPTAGTVVWSDPDIQPIDGYSEWKQISTPSVYSTGGYVSIFLDMRHTVNTSWKVNAFDDAELIMAQP